MLVAKLVCALALAAPLALALQVNDPSNWYSSSPANISWAATATDPLFSIELTHPSFNNKLAIANNIIALQSQPLQVNLPNVPAQSNYTLEFVNISNITQVYASSNPFSIGAPLSSTTSSTLTSSGTSSNSASSPSVTGSTPATSVAGSTGTSGGTGAAAATPSTFGTGGAVALTSNGALGFVAMAAAALAGAQFLGL